MVSFTRKHLVCVWNAQYVREAVGYREVLQIRRAWHVPSTRHWPLIIFQGVGSCLESSLGIIQTFLQWFLFTIMCVILDFWRPFPP